MDTVPVRWLTQGEYAPQLSYPTPTLLMVGGVPGSGKTTLLSHAAPDGVLLLEADRYRGQVQVERGFDADAFEPSCIDEARWRFLSDLGSAIDSGQSVMVDAQLLTRRARGELEGFCEGRPHQVHMLLLAASWEECLTGVSSRARSVELAQLKDYWERGQRMLSRLSQGLVEPGLESVTVMDRAAAQKLQGIRL